MITYYKLNENKEVEEYSGSINNLPRFSTKVKKDIITVNNCSYDISTVFIAINLSYQLDEDSPICFETMVFTNDPQYDGLQKRYATYNEALEGHEQIKKEIEGLNIEYKE